jgi:hypothetical protein
MLDVDAIFQMPGEQLARQNVNAIAVYVQDARRGAPSPAALRLIEAFEGWFGQLEVSTHDPWWPHIVGAEDVGEAKRRRSALNRELGRALPPNRVPADNPQTPPDEPAPLIPPLGLTGAAVGLVALAVAAAYVVTSLRRTA